MHLGSICFSGLILAVIACDGEQVTPKREYINFAESSGDPAAVLQLPTERTRKTGMQQEKRRQHQLLEQQLLEQETKQPFFPQLGPTYVRDFVRRHGGSAGLLPSGPVDAALTDLTSLYERLPKALKVVVAPNFGALVRTLHSVRGELNAMAQEARGEATAGRYEWRAIVTTAKTTPRTTPRVVSTTTATVTAAPTVVDRVLVEGGRRRKMKEEAVRVGNAGNSIDLVASLASPINNDVTEEDNFIAESRDRLERMIGDTAAVAKVRDAERRASEALGGAALLFVPSRKIEASGEDAGEEAIVYSNKPISDEEFAQQKLLRTSNAAVRPPARPTITTPIKSSRSDVIIGSVANTDNNELTVGNGVVVGTEMRFGSGQNNGRAESITTIRSTRRKKKPAGVRTKKPEPPHRPKLPKHLQQGSRFRPHPRMDQPLGFRQSSNHARLRFLQQLPTQQQAHLRSQQHRPHLRQHQQQQMSPNRKKLQRQPLKIRKKRKRLLKDGSPRGGYGSSADGMDTGASSSNMVIIVMAPDGVDAPQVGVNGVEARIFVGEDQDAASGKGGDLMVPGTVTDLEMGVGRSMGVLENDTKAESQEKEEEEKVTIVTGSPYPPPTNSNVAKQAYQEVSPPPVTTTQSNGVPRNPILSTKRKNKIPPPPRPPQMSPRLRELLRTKEKELEPANESNLLGAEPGQRAKTPRLLSVRDPRGSRDSSSPIRRKIIPPPPRPPSSPVPPAGLQTAASRGATIGSRSGTTSGYKTWRSRLDESFRAIVGSFAEPIASGISFMSSAFFGP